MRKVQASFTDAKPTQSIKDGVKQNGKTTMKAFGGKLSDDEIKALVAYVRTLRNSGDLESARVYRRTFRRRTLTPEDGESRQHSSELSQRKIQADHGHDVRRTWQALDFKEHADFYIMVMCASAKPRSLRAFNRFHSSMVFSGCPANRPRIPWCHTASSASIR